jgi:hypothetical protein
MPFAAPIAKKAKPAATALARKRVSAARFGISAS